MTATALKSPVDLGPLYQDYAYGYPHKSAYRAFAAPLRLRDLWAGERKDRIFLYLHLPFCEMRCGFCNLFTMANPDEDRIALYLAALERQIDVIAEELGDVRPVQMALGGGTPTQLGADALERLFEQTTTRLSADPRRIASGIETSPTTATPETIARLSEWGIGRVSIGAQSFIEAETRAMGRPQELRTLEKALDTIRRHRFGSLNIDLIYGASNQTRDSWQHSLGRALEWKPEEIFLYPLYVRSRTGLDGRGYVEDSHRLALYRSGRDFLLSRGYAQVSMRAFQRSSADTQTAGEFSCQEDGVLGLGAGARSYTSAAHYATRYAVTRRGVLDIIDDFSAADADRMRFASHGIEITRPENIRRFVLKSILRRDGLDMRRFEALFGQAPMMAFPVIHRLVDMALFSVEASRLSPTDAGLEHSDAIPPLFYSEAVRERMKQAVIG